jgi:hypothetical protein
LVLVGWLVGWFCSYLLLFDLFFSFFFSSLPSGAAFWMDHLSEDGILVTPISNSKNSRRRQQKTLFDALDDKMEEFRRAGLARALDYSYSMVVGNGNTNNNNNNNAVSVLLYAIAFNSRTGLARWHWDEAHVNLELHRRRLVDLPNSLVDSTILQPLEFPSKASAVEFCKRQDDKKQDDGGYYTCEEKDHGFDPTLQNIPKSQLAVQKSLVGEHAGRGVFASVDIPKGSFISLETSVVPVRASWATFEVMEEMYEENELYQEINGEVLWFYFDGYGFIDEPYVSGWLEAGCFFIVEMSSSSFFSCFG